ncbi:hypothetical protein L2E82_25823 [Cichorium intybus]|uniref:Uncharacterized protein n=1 Tax=Cichorium intybus TaxID=13427 RepID=A0ACB9E5N9_CICIN|nr:hypothetical protein L2E82_25823 [Cichorium intybus]
MTEDFTDVDWRVFHSNLDALSTDGIQRRYKHKVCEKRLMTLKQQYLEHDRGHRDLSTKLFSNNPERIQSSPLRDRTQEDNEAKRKKIKIDAEASGSKDATQMEIDDDHIAIGIGDVKETNEEEWDVQKPNRVADEQVNIDINDDLVVQEDVTRDEGKAEEAAEVKNQDQKLTIDIDNNAERVIQDEKKAQEAGSVRK